MSERPTLEEGLRRLADGLEAPASTTARAAIGQRGRVLRRRRHARNAVVGAAAVVLVVVGLSALSARPDVETGPAGPGGPRLPAVVVDLAGGDVLAVEERLDVGVEATMEAPDRQGSYQVFRRPGAALDGPAVFLEHIPSSDAVVPREDQESVDVGGYPGALTALGRGMTLDWNPGGGDSTARLVAWGLDRTDVLEFAEFLVLRDAAIGYPPVGARFGFDVPPGGLPEGLEEVPVAAPRSTSFDQRTMALARGRTTVNVQVDDQSEKSFERRLGAHTLGAEEVDAVTLLDRPAVVHRPAGDDVWVVNTRLDDRVALQVLVTGADRATLDEILAGVREVDEKEWRELDARY